MRTEASNLRAEEIATQTSFLSQFKVALDRGRPYESIIDFATHKSFCNKRLYPRQKTLLRLLYLETEQMTPYDLDVIEGWRANFGTKFGYGVQPDVWDRVAWLQEKGYTHFPHVESVMGRRASKGVIGGILGAERIAYMVSLDDPQGYYGIEDGHAMYIYVVATNSLQAKRFQFADIASTIESCTYLQKYISVSKDYYIHLRTPSDIRRIATMRGLGIPIEKEIASLRVLAMSSQSSSGRGGSSFAHFYDEMAHMLQGTGGPRTAEEVYEAYQPSLDQFGKDGLTYIPSSPWTMVGKFYDLYQQGSLTFHPGMEANNESDSIADPEMLVVQLPSWELYTDWERSKELNGPRFARPIQWPPKVDSPEGLRMIRLRTRNPEKFKVEREAQFAEVIDAYLDNDKVDAMFAPFWGGRVLEEDLSPKLMYTYQGHGDPGRTNANFAMAIGHCEMAPPDESGRVWPHAVIDYLKIWQPKDYPDHTIDYVEVTDDIDKVLSHYQSMESFTMDAWNSAMGLNTLKRRHGMRIRIREAEFSDKANQVRAEYFKAALNLGWVHSFEDTYFNDGEGCLLAMEAKFLQEKNGKVVKQTFGPVTTKDLFDCVSEVTVRLLKGALDNWGQMYGELRASVGLKGGYPSPRQQGEGFKEENPEFAKKNTRPNQDVLNGLYGKRADWRIATPIDRLRSINRR